MTPRRCRLFNRAFRDRHGVTPEALSRLVSEMRETLVAIHRAGVVVVDLNETNVVVDRHFSRAYFIDVDAWQVPGFRATAIMESIRDRSAPRGLFSTATDWFSFAVVTFQLFVGVHPYRGVHPTIGTMDERMRRNASVFDSRVRIPPSCAGLRALPSEWSAWYRAVLEHGARTPPPRSQPTAPSALASARVSSDVGVTLLTEVRHRQVRAQLEGEQLVLRTVATGETIPFATPVDEMAKHDGRLYGRREGWVFEVRIREVGNRVVATAHGVVRGLPRATRLFDGVVVQDVLGSCWVSLLTGRGRAEARRITSLDGAKILDAHLDASRLAVTVQSVSGDLQTMITSREAKPRGRAPEIEAFEA